MSLHSTRKKTYLKKIILYYMLPYTAVKENPISRQFSETKKENNATAKKAITHFFPCYPS